MAPVTGTISLPHLNPDSEGMELVRARARLTRTSAPTRVRLGGRLSSILQRDGWKAITLFIHLLIPGDSRG